MISEMSTAIELMRIEGICEMLIQTVDAMTLENRFLHISGQESVADIKRGLSSLNKNDLKKIIDMSPEITAEIIKRYFEEYRYGRKPGFVLYWAKGFIGKEINEIDIYENLSNFLVQRTYAEDGKYKNLKLVGVTTWHESGYTVYELGLNYLKKYSYIAESNKFEYIHELVDCFAWINVEKGFVAFYNMPPTIERILSSFILEKYKVNLMGLSLDRTVLDAIFDPDNRTKISLMQYSDKGDRPQKAVFSDPNLSVKQDKVLENYQEYEIGAALYNESIDENTTATLGINSHRGKLYINKNLTTTQFRQWSVKRIVTIIEYFTDIFTDLGIEKFQHLCLFSSERWARMSEKKRNILKKISYAILCCKQKGLNSISLDALCVNDLIKELRASINYCALISCDVCGDTCIPECKCGGRVFSITQNGKILCQRCGKEIQYFKCECGSVYPIEKMDDIISVTIKDSLLIDIIEELRIAVPELTLGDNESVSIYKNQLHVVQANGYKRIQPWDIDDFNELYQQNLTEEQIEQAKKILRQLNEKCNRHPTTDDCEECKYKNFKSMQEYECLQQLFCFFSEFIPKPHHGQEYGDISLSVRVEGRLVNMQGIMKSCTSKITRSGNVGREIIDQVLKGCMDNRTEMIAVIAPALFDDQLKETLQLLGKKFNKKLLFLDADFMYRLVNVVSKTMVQPLKND